MSDTPPSNSTMGLILLGKPFLGNLLLGRDAFKHECSTSSVTHETANIKIIVLVTNLMQSSTSLVSSKMTKLPLNVTQLKFTKHLMQFFNSNPHSC
jgi:hypothetical protein